MIIKNKKRHEAIPTIEVTRPKTPLALLSPLSLACLIDIAESISPATAKKAPMMMPIKNSIEFESPLSGISAKVGKAIEPIPKSIPANCFT